MGTVSSAADSRPNVIVILADDMGIGDVSSLNPKSAWKTPGIDRLAREGRTFTDAHSASGVCTPSRYTLLTGRYSWRGKLKSSVLHGYDPSLIEPGRLTVAGFLKQQGYATGMVGKWHLGVDWVRNGQKLEEVDFGQPFGGGPLSHGFDRFFGISASLDMPPFVYLSQDRSTTVPRDRVAASPGPKMWRAGLIGADFRHEEVHPRFRREALAWIESRAQARAVDGAPFFLYLALASPHTPTVPTPEFVGRTQTNPYGDFVAQVDATVGDILNTLDALRISRDTLVVFTADNGCSPAANLGELRRFGHDPSAGFRGHKADLFEGGHRVPFLVRWPAEVPAGSTCSRLVGQLDLLATLADILGQRLPGHAAEDSISFLPQLHRGDRAKAGRDSLVQHSNQGFFALRQGPWKLLFTPDSGGWSDPKPGSKEAAVLPRLQLYHLGNDSAERTNRVADVPKVARAMTREMNKIWVNGRSNSGRRQVFEQPTEWPQAVPFRNP
jgi:arylsulfatase A-like enzyme